MSQPSPTRRDLLAPAAAAGAVSLLPGQLAAAGDSGTIRPFHLAVPVEQLVDLRERIATTRWRTTRLIAMAVLIAGSSLAMHAAQSQQPGVTRTDLLRHDLGVPGREVVQVRVDLAPGVVFPPHSHPGEEIAYVIEGLLEYRLESKPPVTLKAGEVLFIPAGTVHSARNVGGGNAAELATYIVEKGKPLVTLGQVSVR